MKRTRLATLPLVSCCQQAWCLPAGLLLLLLWDWPAESCAWAACLQCEHQKGHLLPHHQHCCCESLVSLLLLLLWLLAVVWAARGLRPKTPPLPAHCLPGRHWFCCWSAQHCCRRGRRARLHTRGPWTCWHPPAPALLRPHAQRPVVHCKMRWLRRLCRQWPAAAAQHLLQLLAVLLLAVLLLAGLCLLPSRQVLGCQAAPQGLVPSASYTAGGSPEW